MARTNYATPPNPHEAAIIAGATSYAAHVFVGRNSKRTVPCPSKSEARRVAQRLANEHGKPTIIYAIKGGAQAFLENVHPRRAG